MKLRLWGVRGSLATPGPSTLKFGGNTSCYELQGANGECIIMDAGTGIRVAGLNLMKQKPLPQIHLLISHTHWDHIQGFPFFVPCYIPGTKISVLGPMQIEENKSLKSVFDLQMKYEYFPISNQQLAAQISYEALGETKTRIGEIDIATQFTNHPVLSLGYRFTEKGRTFVYTGDHEPYQNLFESKKKEPSEEDDALFGDVKATVADANARFVRFIQGAHVLLIDCTYTPEEYKTSRRGWGHASWDYCLQWMLQANIERMILTHHDPMRSDAAVEAMLAAARAAAVELKIDPERITMAAEGTEVVI